MKTIQNLEDVDEIEYGKAILGGIDPNEAEKEALTLGFSSCTVKHEWYLGQGEVMHSQSFELAFQIEEYLRSIAPLSNHLFKYLQFIFVK